MPIEESADEIVHRGVRRCGSCCFWRPKADDLDTGYCHRMPPVVVATHLVGWQDDTTGKWKKPIELAVELHGAWPQTHESGFCGEWSDLALYEARLRLAAGDA